MSRALPCIRVTTALAAVAIFVAGCADSRMAANNSSQGEQPYKTGYGFTSDGPTTDLYTEVFGSRKTEAAPATAAATTQQMQPVTASTATPVQPATASAPSRPVQPGTATASTRQAQSASATNRQVPAPAPVQVAQQPAAPQPPPEPDVPTMYGITANGPSTDLFTELFGPRRRDGQ